tara:strand:+ start:713 stop:979 length:267 start_codon:yes stop_codon:yes gene_type:complete
MIDDDDTKQLWEDLEVGTLIEDLGKIGIVVRKCKSGTLEVELPLIKWRVNYELFYQDGVITIMAAATMKRLLEEGKIRIISPPEQSEV